MKTKILAVAVGLLLSATFAGQSHAQQVMNANIPFGFAVEGKTLPAGKYQIQSMLSDGARVQSIRRDDGSVSAVVLTITADKKGQETKPRLIFTQYGHEYFLKQIWRAEGTGRELPKSRREKELAREFAPAQVAVLLDAPTVQP